MALESYLLEVKAASE